MSVNQCFNKITDVAGAERLSAEYLHLAAEFHNFAYVIILNMMPMKAIHLLLSALLFFPLVTSAQSDDKPLKATEPYISGVIDGHEYADLGLPSGTLWATCNVGAETYTDTGILVAWGELEPKDEYIWETYKYFEEFVPIGNGFYSVVCTDIGENICATEYDAAYVYWGNKWRMPNYDEIKELRRSCWWSLEEENGVLGLRLHGPNANSIFMPIYVGYDIGGDELYYNGAYYWSGSESDYIGEYGLSRTKAWQLSCDRSGTDVRDIIKIADKAIRPVVNREELASIGQVLTADDACVSYSGGQITIHANVAIKGIDVWGINGTKMLSVSNPEKTVSAANLSPGVYVVRLTGNNKIIRTQKIVVK